MKTNAKINVRHHVKRTHELFKNSKICNYTNALLLILILSIAILGTQMFLNKQNNSAPEAEIRFSELSKDKKILGTIMPASCESNPNVANGDGNFTGCAKETCWNGTVITPAMGQSCPARPTQTCWNGFVVTPSLGGVCPDQYCGDSQASGSIYSNCTCANGNGKIIKKNSTPTPCSPFDIKCVSITNYWCEFNPPVVNIRFQ